MMTILVALFASLAFETPIAVLQKLLFEHLLSESKKAETNFENTPRNGIQIDNEKLS